MSQLKAQVDKILTAASNKIPVEGLIADMVLPALPVDQTTGLLSSYGNGFLRIENSVKGGRGAYRRVDPMTSSTRSYAIEGHGLTDIVTKEDYKNWDDPFQPEIDKTEMLIDMLRLEREYLLASVMTSSTYMTRYTTLSGAAQFSDYLNSDPIDVIQTAKVSVRQYAGVKANAAIMDENVADKLRFHPALLSALGFKDNRPGGLTDAELATALRLKKVLVASAVYNTAKEGQTDSLSPVWGKHMIVAYIPDGIGRKQMSLGYMVKYRGEGDVKVYKQPLFNPPGSTELLAELNYDILLSDAAGNAGYLISNAIA